jgi:ribonuclease H2 subunit A
LQFTVVPKADALFPCVSAASIVAKVTRDVFMEIWKFDEIEGQLGMSSEFGSGYPSGEQASAAEAQYRSAIKLRRLCAN